MTLIALLWIYGVSAVICLAFMMYHIFSEDGTWGELAGAVLVASLPVVNSIGVVLFVIEYTGQFWEAFFEWKFWRRPIRKKSANR